MESADFDRAAYPLFKVALGTWGGFIFINLAGDRAAPLSDALGDVPERFRNYGFADLRIGKRIVMDVKANWKLLFENFSECFHCPPVHPELCEIATLFWDAGAWGLRTDEAGNPLASARPRYKPGAATLTMDGTARIPPFKGPVGRGADQPLSVADACGRTSSSTSTRTTSTRIRCWRRDPRASG